MVEGENGKGGKDQEKQQASQEVSIPTECIHGVMNLALEMSVGDAFGAVMLMTVSAGLLAGRAQKGGPAQEKAAQATFKRIFRDAFDQGRLEAVEWQQQQEKKAQGSDKRIILPGEE